MTDRTAVGGELRSKKGLNLPGIDLGISAFTAHDRACLEFALAHGVDALSQSFVERAAGSSLDSTALRAYLRDHLAPYKIPSEIRFMAALPAAPTGKLLKKDLRKPYWENRDRAI